MVLIISPFPGRKRAFYTCVMKWFQTVCFSAGETNKDNYCQQIPFYPVCRLCLGRARPAAARVHWTAGTISPGVLCVFIYTTQQSRSPVLITPGASVMAVAPSEQSCAFQPRAWEGRGVWERRETAAVGERCSILMCANSPTPAD